VWVIAKKQAEAGKADLEERMKEEKLMFHKISKGFRFASAMTSHVNFLGSM